MSRDSDFRVYIMTNDLDTVLYVGRTNSFERRAGEWRTGEIPGFTADYRRQSSSIWSIIGTLKKRSRVKSSSRDGRERKRGANRETESSLV